MGEQPSVSLVTHVREIGEIEEGGDLNDERLVEENKQDQVKTSTTEPVMIAEGLCPLHESLFRRFKTGNLLILRNCCQILAHTWILFYHSSKTESPDYSVH